MVYDCLTYRTVSWRSWVHEASFLGDSPRTSPYRPGFAAVIQDPTAPGLVNLLDGA